MTSQSKPKIFYQKTLVQMAKNSIGSSTFRNLYAEINGQEADVLKDGELSCAVFVTSILATLGLIDEGHATVKSTTEHLKEAGWEEVDLNSPQLADVIVWDKIEYADGSEHQHIGFYIGKDMTISNSAEKRIPQQHNWTYDGQRSPILLLRYDFSKLSSSD